MLSCNEPLDKVILASTKQFTECTMGEVPSSMPIVASLQEAIKLFTELH